ncbi:MAG TPA: FecR domain-containing protein [Gemmatimonadaceae bacterium]|nr:FecR domain-containing protein [Gemmatimonadaceae bacterium]
MSERPGLDGIDAELIDRYLAGEGTESENAVVRRWLMTRPDVARALGEFVDSLDGERGRPSAPDSVASLGALRARMRRDESPSVSQHGDPVSRNPPAPRPSASFAPLVARRASRWTTLARVAAAAGVVALAVAAGLYRAPRGAPSAPPVAERQSQTYSTQDGERAELRLQDGTHVRLAPASRLRIAADFGDERRDVYLEGEAYFDVTHDERRPFTVFAGNASAQDLGTGFAVRSYADDRAVQVIVREGAVALSGVGRLERGDLGRLTADGTPTLRRGVDVDSLLSWLDGRLTFVDAPLADVLLAVRRWHAIDVQLSDTALAAIPFTGALTNASAEDAIDFLAVTLGMHAERHGARVTLTPIEGRTPSRH